jgi:hypothetical protein
VKAKGIVWLGTRTERFDEMCDLFGEITGAPPRLDDPGLAVFDLPNGDRIELFSTAAGEEFMVAPVVGFLVDDVAAARAELESRGIEFIGPIHTAANGWSWSHFRAPDGHVYEVNARPDPAQAT